MAGRTSMFGGERATQKQVSLDVVEQGCPSAIRANQSGHVLRIHGVLDSYTGYL
jgi:hypothetical protein